MEKFTHVLENVLDRLRNGEIAVSDQLVTCCCAAATTSARCSIRSRKTGARRENFAAAGVAIADALRAWDCRTAGGGGAGVAPQHPAGEGAQGGRGHGHQRLLAYRCVSAERAEERYGPLAFLRYLLSSGDRPHDDPRRCRPRPTPWIRKPATWASRWNCAATPDKAAIEQVFDFVRDDCDLHILPPNSRIADYVALIEKPPEETMRPGEILVGSGAPDRRRTGLAVWPPAGSGGRGSRRRRADHRRNPRRPERGPTSLRSSRRRPPNRSRSATGRRPRPG